MFSNITQSKNGQGSILLIQQWLKSSFSKTLCHFSKSEQYPTSTQVWLLNLNVLFFHSFKAKCFHSQKEVTLMMPQNVLFLSEYVGCGVGGGVGGGGGVKA